jgi:hypothetical protein
MRERHERKTPEKDMRERHERKRFSMEASRSWVITNYLNAVLHICSTSTHLRLASQAELRMSDDVLEHTLPMGFTTSAGHVAEDPVHVSVMSQTSPS